MKKKFKKESKKSLLERGFSLVEVVVATSIILFFFSSLMAAYTLYLRIIFINPDVVSAALLAEEGIEAVKLLRDESWQENIKTLSLNTPYFLVFEEGMFKSTTTPLAFEGRFYRTFELKSVLRDSSGDIVLNGGSVDENTKYLDMKIEWSSRGASSTRIVSTYITNLFNN